MKKADYSAFFIMVYLIGKTTTIRLLEVNKSEVLARYWQEI
ncbi:hypothetical protein SAMN05216379_10886 [Nitrosomonas eutropha]|uniref:Integrase n=1 Tax=Nitrosomonas eutropha TaxID=916 RepID=A0ABX5M8J0_9PROT|nr:hypothetical protein C8R14_10821 [Nitrosomonas eutropha]SCX13762.1 hypothetical protein SAMN05216379_10886 [Nitrosomonas eutropha]SEI69071.1 hypothetical protein SAMN05216318_10875 [Nitrosomonas eutropha]